MSKFTRIPIAATLMIATALSPQAHAIYHGSEVGVEIDSHDKANAVVQVGYCTGTAIAPHWVITANHCMKHVTKPIAVHRSLERKKRNEHPRYWGKWYFHHPEADLTLVYLDKPFEHGPFAPLGAGKVAPSTPAEVYGWGAGTGQRLGYTTAQVVIDGWGSIGYRSRALFVTYDNNGYAGGGDSGGPLFVDNKLVGVLSSGNRTVSDFDEINGKLDWVKKTMAEGPHQAFAQRYPEEPLDGQKYHEEVVIEAPLIEALGVDENTSHAPQPPINTADETTPHPHTEDQESGTDQRSVSGTNPDKHQDNAPTTPPTRPENEVPPAPAPKPNPQESTPPHNLGEHNDASPSAGGNNDVDKQKLDNPQHHALIAVITAVVGILATLVAGIVHLLRTNRIF
ncbi:MAG: trypsin-like serine protease [Corynebacterium sp.]|uniref:trypsin-like serine protease n=1 Tax=Corynebacterium sp. TaxID=1720 RepID=UPI0026DDA2DA|nr:trypsin-like serine protease [Corynebacterium sp.]MDO4761669.1 trypsin-like serine protease [Corynebacterium sp.]